MLGYKTIEEFDLQECEAFLNRADVSEEDRQRAERRKTQLIVSKQKAARNNPVQRTPMTVIDRFPNIKFVMNPKRHFIPSWFWWTLPIQLMGTFCSMGGLLVLLWAFYHFRHKQLKNRFIEETDNKFKLVSDLYKLGLYNKNTLRILVPIEYDNIVKTALDFFVVEKNGKKGVYKRKKLLIPVEYDKLEWNSTNNVFNAEKDGRQILFDINGRKLN